MKTLLLCALVAGVGGAACTISATPAKDGSAVCAECLPPDCLSYTATFKGRTVSENCLPLNTPIKNVPEGYCVSGLKWCPCPETVEMKIEKLEKRLDALEKKIKPSEQKPIMMWPTGCFDGTEPKRNCEDNRNDHYHSQINPDGVK